MKNVVRIGLPLLVALLLVGGCASSSCNPCNEPNPCNPCPDPCPPVCEPQCVPCGPPCPPNTGQWPDVMCDPATARGMLNTILHWAQQAGSSIKAEDLTRIEARIPECLDPGLEGSDPPPCQRLREIYDEADHTRTLPNPEAQARWHTIADELDSFPNLPVSGGGN